MLFSGPISSENFVSFLSSIQPRILSFRKYTRKHGEAVGSVQNRFDINIIYKFNIKNRSVSGLRHNGISCS